MEPCQELSCYQRLVTLEQRFSENKTGECDLYETASQHDRKSRPEVHFFTSGKIFPFSRNESHQNDALLRLPTSSDIRKGIDARKAKLIDCHQTNCTLLHRDSLTTVLCLTRVGLETSNVLKSWTRFETTALKTYAVTLREFQPCGHSIRPHWETIL